MSELDQRIEISETTISKLGSGIAALTPIALGLFQYLNDPENLVGVLICVVLFISLMLWRNTQQQLREVKAAYVLLSKKFEDASGRHSKYGQITSNTITNMMMQIGRLSGYQDAGSLVLDPDTGAQIYNPPPLMIAPPPLRRASDVVPSPAAPAS